MVCPCTFSFFLASHIPLILPLQPFWSKIWAHPPSSSLTALPAPPLTLSHTLTILFIHHLSVSCPYIPPKLSLQLIHIIHPCSPSYILPGCQHLVLECLHPPKGLCMAPGRYVFDTDPSPFTFPPPLCLPRCPCSNSSPPPLIDNYHHHHHHQLPITIVFCTERAPVHLP